MLRRHALALAGLLLIPLVGADLLSGATPVRAAVARAEESQQAFARRMMERLKAAGVDRPMRFDPEKFAIVVGTDEDRTTIYLHNAYEEHRAADRDAAA